MKKLKEIAIVSVTLLSLNIISTSYFDEQALANSTDTSETTVSSSNNSNTVTPISSTSPQLPPTTNTNSMTSSYYNGINAPKASISYNGNDTIISINDSDMISYYRSHGILIPLPLLARSSNGVTKIIWHGAARHGNFDLYISRNTLVLYHALWAAGDLVASIVDAYFGEDGEATKDILAAILNTAKAGSINNGIHYEVHHWTSIKEFKQ